MRAIRGHQFEYPFLVTIFTGMREGEVLGLKWDCVNFTTGIILVGQQLQLRTDGKGYRLISPKTASAAPLPRPPLLWIS